MVSLRGLMASRDMELSRGMASSLAPLGMTLYSGLALLFVIAAVLAPEARAQDSTFLLSSTDPARSPSPFIGNGRIGLVVPALGIGDGNSIVAGLYEHAPSDVPRIVAIPTWSDIDICRTASAGSTRRRSEPAPSATTARCSTCAPALSARPTTGSTAPAAPAWRSRASSRARTPPSPRYGSRCTPDAAGPLRLRFALAGRPPPHRLAARDRSPAPIPQWRPADVWYPGHMVVRSRAATRASGGARLSLSRDAGGTDHRARAVRRGRVASRSLPRAGPHRHGGRHGHGRGRVRRGAGQDLHLHPSRRLRNVRLQTPARPLRASRAAESRERLGAGRLSPRPTRWPGVAAGRPTSRSTATPRLQRVVRSMLFYLLASGGRGHRAGHSADGAVRRRLLRARVLGFRHLDVPLAAGHPSGRGALAGGLPRGARSPPPGPTRGPTASRARCTPGRRTSEAGRPRRRSRFRTPRWRSTSTATSRWRSGSTISPPAIPRGWRPTGFPVIRETADFWVSRARRDSAPRPLSTSTAWSRCTRDSSA